MILSLKSTIKIIYHNLKNKFRFVFVSNLRIAWNGKVADQRLFIKYVEFVFNCTSSSKRKL